MNHAITLALALSSLGFSAHAQFNIYYVLSGTHYSYTVQNATSVDPLDLFSIYFPAPQDPTALDYNNLAAADSPAGWTGSALEPGVPDMGGLVTWQVDLPPGITTGQSLSGFEATFDHSGTSVPGRQYFEVYDANYNVIGSGLTQRAAVGTVPDGCNWQSWGCVGLLLLVTKQFFWKQPQPSPFAA